MKKEGKKQEGSKELRPDKSGEPRRLEVYSPSRTDQCSLGREGQFKICRWLSDEFAKAGVPWQTFLPVVHAYSTKCLPTVVSGARACCPSPAGVRWGRRVCNRLHIAVSDALESLPWESPQRGPGGEGAAGWGLGGLRGGRIQHAPTQGMTVRR